MSKSGTALVVVALAAVVIIVGCCVWQGQNNSNENDIVGMYNISEYHQYAMDDGSFVYCHSGDGSYDSEFIEITSCKNGIFEGYCCIPMEGETNPPHYPILGTYNSKNCSIQYVCSYSYPSTGLYDWVLGYIVGGVMQLSGFTYGDDDEYYGSFEFTFVKKGCKTESSSYDPVFEVGDKYRSFKVLQSIEGKESISADSVSFEVKNAAKGLYKFDVTLPGSDKPVVALGAAVDDHSIEVIGFSGGKPFSLTMTDYGTYVQISREYLVGTEAMTWTAYTTEDGKGVAVKDAPQFDSVKFIGKFSYKVLKGDAKTGDGFVTLKKISDTFVEMNLNNEEKLYGNFIQCSSSGSVILLSESGTGASGTGYYFGLIVLNEKNDVVYYSGADVYSDGTLRAMIFDGQKE